MKTKITETFTIDEVKAGVPNKSRSLVTQGFCDILNAVNQDNETLLEQFRRNFFTYSDILTEGKYSLDEYMNAVQFVTLLLFGKTDVDAYVAVFPERYQELLNKGYIRDQVGAWVYGFKKTQLVQKLLEKSTVAPYIIYQNIYHKAIMNLLELATNARSEMVKAKANETLVNQLKMPDTIKAKLEVNVKQDRELMDELRAVTEQLASQQLKAIQLKASSVTEIAHSKIIPDYIESEVE